MNNKTFEQWFERLLSSGFLPDVPEGEVPEDYFDFNKFQYDSWQASQQDALEELHSNIQQDRGPAPNIVVDETSGVVVVNNLGILFFIHVYYSNKKKKI